MGAEQSQPEKSEGPVKIDRSDIPEAYLNVGVSDNVVRRVKSAQPQVDDSEKRHLEEQLRLEREANYQLRQQMMQLTELQQRLSANTEVPPPQKMEGISLDDMQERNRVFDDTVERVKKQFFSFQRENMCVGNEQEILECLDKNNGQHLKCKPLLPPYQECIGKFKEEVLAQTH